MKELRYAPKEIDKLEGLCGSMQLRYASLSPAKAMS